MSDSSIAAIARELARAMISRAKSRQPDDLKVVLDLQTQLVAEFRSEEKKDAEESPIELTTLKTSA